VRGPGWGDPERGWRLAGQQLLHGSGVVSEPGGLGRGAILPPQSLPLGAQAQALVTPHKGVDRAHQTHDHAEDCFAMGQGTGVVSERSQGCVEDDVRALAEGGVDLMLAATGRSQHLGHCLWVLQDDPLTDRHHLALEGAFRYPREQQHRRTDARWYPHMPQRG